MKMTGDAIDVTKELDDSRLYCRKGVKILLKTLDAEYFGLQDDRLDEAVRVSSQAYWEADQWDPDQRVYVGAGAGQGNHLTAVNLDKPESGPAASELSRIWVGGLASTDLGFGEELGPPVDLTFAQKEKRAALQDLYDIQSKSVGSGSFGVVRAAVHRASGTSCVVKSVKKDAAGERYRQSVEQEGGIFEMLLRMSHKELRHPNLVRYFDMLEGPKHYFVIMEELSGPELMQQVEDLFPVTEAYLQRVLRQVLAGLAHIHGPVGTVHRDVKLSNFRYRSPGSESELVLLDFGFAL
ncbi:unnamed protein product, partial [Polarella glacialis]